jgi:hypothetical protein
MLFGAAQNSAAMSDSRHGVSTNSNQINLIIAGTVFAFM